MTIDSIVTARGYSRDLAYSIMQDRLNLQKMCSLGPSATDRGTQKYKNQMGICFNLFGPQKQHLGGKQLADDDNIQHEVLLRMTQQPKEFL
ncbi:hypothetical protein TNCT_111901 [Trichonephila clavata]|uniref:Uncharacterized protein n=1 Tax=Trichonephila clavata TaxID=2740835 RepID=A0A8X6KTE3_TRICU|nr:hypothetical protein TNCT_111901 [Trichonephila clavata]